MDSKKLKYFESQLLKRKKELEEYLSATEEKFSLSQRDSSADLSSQPTHTADIAADAEMKESAAYFISSTVDELHKVDKALKRIHSNTYGLCEQCGGEINIERLKAIPCAEFCIKCGEKL